MFVRYILSRLFVYDLVKTLNYFDAIHEAVRIQPIHFTCVGCDNSSTLSYGNYDSFAVVVTIYG